MKCCRHLSPRSSRNYIQHVSRIDLSSQVGSIDQLDQIIYLRGFPNLSHHLVAPLDPIAPLGYGGQMEANEHFKELVRLGRLPGPNNLLAPTAEFVRGTRSARRREISTHLERAWQAAGGAPLSGQAWGSREEREKWELRLKPALRKLRAQGALRETAIHGVYESVTADTALGADGNDGAEISLGSGNYLVYGTYDKRVRETARAQDEERWLMKVGSTKER